MYCFGPPFFLFLPFFPPTVVDWWWACGISSAFLSLAVKQQTVSLCGFRVYSNMRTKYPQICRPGAWYWLGLPSQSVHTWKTSRFKFENIMNLYLGFWKSRLSWKTFNEGVKWFACVKYDLMNMLALLWLLSCALWVVFVNGCACFHF